VGLFLNGDAIPSPGPHGERIVDDSFLFLINASPEARKWTVSGPWGDRWAPVLDTGNGPPSAGDGEIGGDLVVTDRSVVLLRRLS
jgi:glycogen operon protein